MNLMTSSREDRRLLGEILVIAFVAVAYHEGLNTFRDSLREPGELWQKLALFGVFFLTALRFFIGNHFHLQNEAVISHPRAWRVDFLVIMLETAVLGFLGSVSPF